MSLNFKSFNFYILFLLLFIPIFLLVSCDNDNNSTEPVVLKIDPDDDSCVPLTDQYATCAEACEAEPLNCAADILLHIESNGFISRRELNPTIDNETGEILPGIEQKPNIQSPMHGLFVPVWNNPQLNDAIETALMNPFDTFVAPPWSISAKLNSAVTPENSNPRDLEWSTVMYKIPGYCVETIFPGDPDAPCLGGEWFWFLNRGGFLSFDWNSEDNSSVPAFGKANDFCLACHGAVADTDWLWITHDLIRRQQQLQGSSIIDGHTPASGGAGFCDGITELSPDRPTDVLLDPASLSGEQANRMFNCYSWQTFVAMFWPASETQRGVPDKTKSIADQGQRVWGTYKQTYEMFQPRDPEWTLDDQSWNDDQPLPDVCRDALIANDMPMDSKSYQILNETHQAFGSQFNNLIDQNNNEVHYNVRVNRDEFERMKEQGFADTGTYDYNGPLGINKSTFQMPDNTVGATGEGASEVKSAWKIMCTDPETCNNVDDPSRYYTETVLIYTPPIPKVIDSLDPSIVPQNTITEPATCEVAEVGLVGFHIAVKTFWAPQWIWPTFEHIDNVPGNTGEGEPIPDTFSFFDTGCPEPTEEFLEKCIQERPGVIPNDLADDPELRCCPNQMNILNSSPDTANEESDLVDLIPPNPIPVQVNRLDAIGQNSPNQVSVLEFNELFRGLLAEEDSPLQNYVLVNTQWPGNGRTSADTDPPYQVINKLCLEGDDISTCFDLVPKSLRLRNSTIETYDMAYCEPTEEDISNEGGPDCNPDDVADDPMQSSSGGCMNCHFSSGTDSSFIWADAIEEQVPLEN